MQMKKLTKKIK